MNHETHKTRYSDSSIYDEVCEYCGATDANQAVLDRPCPVVLAAREICLAAGVDPDAPSYQPDNSPEWVWRVRDAQAALRAIKRAGQ